MSNEGEDAVQRRNAVAEYRKKLLQHKELTSRMMLKTSICAIDAIIRNFMVRATALLQKNLDNAKASLEVLIADLQFLRDQVTIIQVTIARVYNWDVHQRKVRQAASASTEV